MHVPLEFFADVPWFPAIESKSILSKIVLQVFRFESTMTGSSDEPFDQHCPQLSALQIILIADLAWVRCIALAHLFVNDIVGLPRTGGEGRARLDFFQQ